MVAWHAEDGAGLRHIESLPGNKHTPPTPPSKCGPSAIFVTQRPCLGSYSAAQPAARAAGDRDGRPAGRRVGSCPKYEVVKIEINPSFLPAFGGYLLIHPCIRRFGVVVCGYVCFSPGGIAGYYVVTYRQHLSLSSRSRPPVWRVDA